MNDETPLVEESSLLVSSLKQRALMKIAGTLIRPDPEMFCSSVCHIPLQRFTGSIKQLPISESCQNDIRSAISSMYRHLHDGVIRRARSFTSSTVKFNACGDVDVQKTFDDYVERICRAPSAPQQYLSEFLADACRFHQEQCVHVMLCELAKWETSGLEPSLRNARPEVEVQTTQNAWHYKISFVIKDLVDPAPWTFFVTMLNNDLDRGSQSYFRGNVLSVSTPVSNVHFGMMMLWPKMTTVGKYEHAAEMFKVALDQSDTRLLVQTMHYLPSIYRMQLIKANLVPFILCFLTRPYYRRFLPDLPLVTEDIELLVQEDVHRDLKRLLSSLEEIGDYTNFSDCLVQLWKYFALRDETLGDGVFSIIREYLYRYANEIYEWFDYEGNEAKIAFTELREIFAPDL